MIWKLIRWFLFRLDAERAHLMTLRLIRMGMRFRNIPLRIASGEGSLKNRSNHPASYSVFGLSFSSRVGLAAGFDKNAEVLSGLPALGFGFAELGTVTPRPQAGNSCPRLFRDSKNEAIFNRMGFNSEGAVFVSEQLKQAKPLLPESFRVGVNLGKNRDTSLEDAHKDYVQAARAFEALADYLVINVSSPNTPGLRSLQTVEALRPIVESLKDLISGWVKVPPLLLKLAPELGGGDLRALIHAFEDHGIDGWVLTNTLQGTIHRDGIEYSGGWSGKPLSDFATQSLKAARMITKQGIVSVGGISSPKEAMARIHAGADLVQIYTGWVYGGPGFPVKIAKTLNLG